MEKGEKAGYKVYPIVNLGIWARASALSISCNNIEIPSNQTFSSTSQMTSTFTATETKTLSKHWRCWTQDAFSHWIRGQLRFSIPHKISFAQPYKRCLWSSWLPRLVLRISIAPLIRRDWDLTAYRSICTAAMQCAWHVPSPPPGNPEHGNLPEYRLRRFRRAEDIPSYQSDRSPEFAAYPSKFLVTTHTTGDPWQVLNLLVADQRVCGGTSDKAIAERAQMLGCTY